VTKTTIDLFYNSGVHMCIKPLLYCKINSRTTCKHQTTDEIV